MMNEIWKRWLIVRNVEKKKKGLRGEIHIFNLCLKKYSTEFFFFTLNEKRLYKILSDNLVYVTLSESLNQTDTLYTERK